MTLLATVNIYPDGLCQGFNPFDLRIKKYCGFWSDIKLIIKKEGICPQFYFCSEDFKDHVFLNYFQAMAINFVPEEI